TGTAAGQPPPADLILTNGGVATQDKARPTAPGVAIKDGKFVVVGPGEGILAHRGGRATSIDAKGRTVVPRLIHPPPHAIRAGRFYNLELRWDGVPTLKQAMAMLRDQAKRTPKGQWVRVVGGWSAYQFQERRMPTPEELTEAAPDTPVFVLFLYSRGFLNR